MSRRRRGSPGKNRAQHRPKPRPPLAPATDAPPTGPVAEAAPVQTTAQSKTETTKPARPNSHDASLKRGYTVWSTVWGVLGPIITLAGLLFAAQPDVEMVNQPAPDPTDVYTTPFQIHNSSAFAMRDVRVTCDQHWNGKDSAQIWHISYRDPNGTIHEIARREPATTSCYSPGSPYPMMSHTGAIFFHLRFKYGWWPFDVTRHFAFQATPYKDQVVLTAQPTGIFMFNDQPVHSVDGK